MYGNLFLFADGPIDWGRFFEIWGPAAPVLAALFFMLHRAVFKVVPRGFRDLRKALESANADSERRHSEAIVIMRRVEQKLDAIPMCRKSGRSKPAK